MKKIKILYEEKAVDMDMLDNMFKKYGPNKGDIEKWK